MFHGKPLHAKLATSCLMIGRQEDNWSTCLTQTACWVCVTANLPVRYRVYPEINKKWSKIQINIFTKENSECNLLKLMDVTHMKRAKVPITPQVWHAWWNWDCDGYPAAASMTIHHPIKNCHRDVKNDIIFLMNVCEFVFFRRPCTIIVKMRSFLLRYWYLHVECNF